MEQKAHARGEILSCNLTDIKACLILSPRVSKMSIMIDGVPTTEES